METVNVSPAETRRTLWHVCGAIGVLIFLWRLPDLLSVLIK